MLSNGQLEVKISKKGRITSIVDLALNRELIDEGRTAGFVLFEDRCVPLLFCCNIETLTGGL